MGGILIAILIGLVVGFLARAVLPGRQDVGILWTIVIGVVGSIIGNYIGKAINPDSDPMHWILSVLVAVGLLMLFVGMSGRRSRV